MRHVYCKAQERVNRGLKHFIADANNIETLKKYEKFCGEFAKLHIQLKDATTLGEKYSTEKAGLAKEKLETLVRDFQAYIKNGQGWGNFVENMNLYMDATDPLYRAPVIDPNVLHWVY